MSHGGPSPEEVRRGSNGATEVISHIDDEIQNTEEALRRLGKVFEKVETARPTLQKRALEIGTSAAPSGASEPTLPGEEPSGASGRVPLTQREPAQVVNSIMGVVMGGIFLAGYTLTAEETSLIAQVVAAGAPLALNWLASREIRAQVVPTAKLIKKG